MLLVLACSDDDPVRAPQNVPPDDTSFSYPLAIGNTWEYAHTHTVRFLKPDGSEHLPPQFREATSTRELTGIETRGESEYVVEREVFTVVGSEGPVTSWRRYRQDEMGLHRADVSLGNPPADDDETADESVRLSYPLEVGKEWVPIAGDEAATATVEARESIVLPAGTLTAYRVAIRTSSMDPNDYKRYWYGRDGLLRVERHTEFGAVDVSTGIPMTVTIDEIQSLTSVSLDR